MPWKLISQYQKDQSEENENKVLEAHRPYIQANINKWKGALPDAVLNTYGRSYALEAFKTFDPTKANINTHLYNHLSQLQRLVLGSQNVAAIPEHQAQMLSRVNHAVNYLKDELGRDPEVHEIADHMSLPVAHIARVLKNDRKDFLNDSDAETQQFATGHDFAAKERIFATRQSLSPLQRQQFDDLTGFGGKDHLELSEFGKKYRMKPYEVSRLKATLAKRFK